MKCLILKEFAMKPNVVTDLIFFDRGVTPEITKADLFVKYSPPSNPHHHHEDSAFVLLSYVATLLPTSGLTHLTTGGVAKAAINFNHAPTYIIYYIIIKHPSMTLIPNRIWGKRSCGV
jgi:hypothetical protein